jgi:lysophospholipase L1-like esterase
VPPRARPDPATPPTDRALPDRDGRALRAVGVAAGLGLVGLAGHATYRVLRLVRDAPRHLVVLDHDRVVGEGLGEPIDLVVLGDSAADGYAIPDARHAYPHQVAVRLSVATGRRVRVRSLAVSGARTRDLVDDQAFQLRGGAADVVAASVGVNDALRRTPGRELRAATHELVTRLGEVVPDALVVLAGAPDLSTAPGLPPALRRLVGWRCRVVARHQRAVAEERGVAFVAYDHPPTTAMYGPDGLHPGPLGQAAAADATVDTVMRASQEAPWTYT